MPGTPVNRVSRQLVPPRPKVIAPAPPEPAPTPKPVAVVPFTPHWSRILREVSEKHGIDEKSMLSNARNKHIVAARNEAYWRMRHEIVVLGQPMSLPQIGRRFGRDHTTVIWGMRQHEKAIKAQAGTKDSPTIHTQAANKCGSGLATSESP